MSIGLVQQSGNQCHDRPCAIIGQVPVQLETYISPVVGKVRLAEQHMSGCQALCLRHRAQAMRRSHSDSSLAGWCDCRDKHCNCMLGPLDTWEFDGANDRLIYISSERMCPRCGTTTSTHLRIDYALKILSMSYFRNCRRRLLVQSQEK